MFADLNTFIEDFLIVTLERRQNRIQGNNLRFLSRISENIIYMKLIKAK